MKLQVNCKEDYKIKFAVIFDGTGTTSDLIKHEIIFNIRIEQCSIYFNGSLKLTKNSIIIRYNYYNKENKKICILSYIIEYL